MQTTHRSPKDTLGRVERLLHAAPDALAATELAAEVEDALNESCGQLLALEARAARTGVPSDVVVPLREGAAALRARAHRSVGSPRLADGAALAA
jgi:hypothetical protein